MSDEQKKKTVMVTVHGHSNYATGGVDIVVEDLGYVTDAAVLQVGSNIIGQAVVQATVQTQSGQKPEGIHSSGNIVTLQLLESISGAISELGDTTSLSGVTAVLLAQGY